MIKSLRKKFILINMALVFLVLAVVFSFLLFSQIGKAKNESQMALQSALGRKENGMQEKFEFGSPPKDFIRYPVFVVEYGPSGTPKMIFSDQIDISEQDLAAIAEAALELDVQQGILEKYQLRFCVRQEKNHLRIAFLERSAEINSIRQAVFTSVLSFLGSLAGFFLISLFLSRLALAPTVRAWEQQQRFVSDASHELKTPLTVILANLNILQTNKDDTIDNQMKWVQNTKEEATRMKGLVDKLLFLAKNDNQKQALPLSSLNLSDLVLRVSLAFEAVAFEKGTDLNSSELTPGLFVRGQQDSLVQLIEILLDNAVKYGEEKSPVYISLRAVHGKAVLAVSNRGEPIAQKDLPHLFERFYRADQSRSNEGYGLGLSIAAQIVRNHGGKISASSENGTNTFLVSLPLTEEEK